MESAPHLIPNAPDQAKRRMVGHTASAILDDPIRDPEWVVHDIVAPGSITTLGGYVGAGKSPVLRRMVTSVLMGQEFLGRPTRLPEGFKVAYLAEEPRRSFTLDMRAARIGRGVPFQVFYFDEHAGLPWDDIVGEIAQRLDGCGWLIVDTGFRWAQVRDLGGENDPGVMDGVYEPLQVAAGSGLAVTATAHTVKSISKVPDDETDIAHIRGSGSVVAASDVILLYRRLYRDPTSSTRFLRWGRSRLADPAEDTYVTLEPEGHLTAVAASDIQAARAADDERKVIQLVQRLGNGGPVPQRTVRDAPGGVRKIDFDDIVNGLVWKCVLERRGSGKRGDPYTLEVLP